MLLIDKAKGNQIDMPTQIAERLIKKGTHVAVNPNESFTLETSKPVPLSDAMNHINEIKKDMEKIKCECGDQCCNGEEPEVISDNDTADVKEIEIITPEKSHPKEKNEIKRGRHKK